MISFFYFQYFSFHKHCGIIYSVLLGFHRVVILNTLVHWCMLKQQAKLQFTCMSVQTQIHSVNLTLCITLRHEGNQSDTRGVLHLQGDSLTITKSRPRK